MNKIQKGWSAFKVGNRLIARDFWRWAKGDVWPWLLTLATIVFIVTVYVFESFFVANLWASILFLLLFAGFALFVNWKVYKLEVDRDD